MLYLYLFISFILISAIFYSGLVLLLYIRSKRYHTIKEQPLEAFTLAKFIRFVLQLFKGIMLFIYWGFAKSSQNRLIHPIQENDNSHVLCVHGFHVNGSCFWGMRKFLRNEGFSSSAIHLGLPYIKVQRYVDKLAKIISIAASNSPTGKIHIVAHSMGGLIIRMLLQQSPQYADKLSSIITLGTPHKGTATVRKNYITWIRELFHTDSDLIVQMEDFHALAPQVPATTIASRHDLVVYPAINAHTSKANNITVDWMSHMGLLTEQSSQQLVYDCLDMAESSSNTTSHKNRGN